MKIFTEFELREQYSKTPFSTFCLPPDCRLSPAAVQFLNDRKIKVVTGEQNSPKPEHMTHLRGRDLVDKRHPRIRLRGKLDTVQAQIIDTVIEMEMLGQGQMARQLKELLELSRAVLRAEVTGEELPEPGFAGLNSDAIRETSHHPEKHIGVGHFLPSPVHGRMMSRLNLLRTAVRETELEAAQAFHQEDGGNKRTDIMETLNRMSSMVYIMMCRLLAGQYSIGDGTME
ncbi:MAG: cobalamin adenosyltransferase [Clostridia bacterium]|nr:cobalamin adenosyltransferase [Clostridia bacterium]